MKKYKPLISRRLLIALAIIVMAISFLTDRPIAGLLIIIAMVFLAMTIFISISMGCGACWAGFWLSDEKLDCMGRSTEFSRDNVMKAQEAQIMMDKQREKEGSNP